MSNAAAASRRPPGPSEPVDLGIDPPTLEILERAQRRFGNTVCFETGKGRPAYFINEPADVRQLLVRHHGRYRKGPGFERVKMLLGNGLIVGDGDTWRRSRTMIQPAFKVQSIHRLLATMVRCTDQCALRWAKIADDGGTVNITEETSEFSLELILRCIFGDDYDERIVSDGDNPFAFLSRESARDLGVVMKVRELRRLLLDVIGSRRANETAGESGGRDFLGMYLAARDKAGRPFSDDELLDELMTLVIAGFETSANTLNWTWYLLAGHPDVESRLLREAAELLPGVDAVSADATSAMQYTQQVLEETLRLYPPVWLFTRRADADDRIGEFDVPDGADIYLSPYLLHRTESIWPEPDRFDPGRFDPDVMPRRDRPYFPFSLGPRRCLGEYFSFLEMKVHLGLLLPRFRMMRVDHETPALDLGINLRSARDIYLRPETRLQSLP